MSVYIYIHIKILASFIPKISDWISRVFSSPSSVRKTNKLDPSEFGAFEVVAIGEIPELFFMEVLKLGNYRRLGDCQASHGEGRSGRSGISGISIYLSILREFLSV